ncbi:MAG TPA: DUF3352 domain-containing protein [Candidatus Limnocylindria bacterium]
MSASIQPATGLGGWRVLVIGLVGALAIGIGAAAGTFLLEGRASGASAAAAQYVPADSPFYMEWHVEPSGTQDAALRELLGRFPEIDGIDLTQPLYDQLTAKLDEELATASQGLTWAGDVEPWFDGTISMAVTSIPDELLSGEMDPMAEPPAPGFVVILGSEDAAAARAGIDRLTGEMASAVTETTHAGVSLFESADADTAWAITDDAVLVGQHAADIRAALDTDAAGTGGVAGSEIDRLVAALPDDRLGFVVYDLTELMEASLDAAEAQDPGTAAAMRSMLEGQSFRGAIALHAAGDRLAFDAAAPNGTGAFALVNEDRGLAAVVPADALYYAEGANLGLALENVVTSLKTAAAADPVTEDQIATGEAALGAELEELVTWIGDGAMVAGWDGTTPYAGVVIEPTDRDAAQRRLDQLVTFAGLAAMDPSAGITIDESEVAGTTVTTIRWMDPNADVEAFGMPAGEVVIQVALTDAHALIGVGDAFVGRALELDTADSLASVARFTDAVNELGGTSSAGTVWWDVAGTREAVEAAMGPMMGMMDPDGQYEALVQPWLLPLDRLVTVSVVEGDLVLQHGALFVE